MKRIDWSSLDAAGKKAALARPAQRTAGDVTDVVRTILEDVRARGGAAVTEWCLKLDKAPPRRIAITPEAVAEAQSRRVPPPCQAGHRPRHDSADRRITLCWAAWATGRITI